MTNEQRLELERDAWKEAYNETVAMADRQLRQIEKLERQAVEARSLAILGFAVALVTVAIGVLGL